MAEKTLNTRILLKYDSYTNWYNNNPKLLKGEVAIATIPENHTDPSTGEVTQIPAVVMKVGTGADTGSNYNDLPFVSAKAADVLTACKSKAGLKAFVNGVINGTDGIGERVGAVEEAIGALNGDVNTTGSVAKAIKDAIDELELDNTYVAQEAGKSLVSNTEITKLASVSEGANKVEASTNGNIKIDGVDTVVYTHPNKHAITDVDGLQDALDSKVASVSAGNASITVAGNATAPTVAVKLDPSADNAIKLNENGLKVEIGAAPEYTIVKADDAGDYAAVYNLTKDNEIVGVPINIPKDMVVKSGTVVTNPDELHEGTYIELVLQNVDEPLYINVGDLIEYVTSGSATGDMVVVNVDAAHKVTATITDGTITLAKLESDVQTSIGKANTALQPEDIGTMAEKNADDYLTKTETTNAINEAKNALIGTANTSDGNEISIYGARAYVENSINTLVMDGAVADNTEAIEAINNETNGILAQAKAYANSLPHEDTKYTAAADGGLKLDPTNNNAFSIDDAVTFILDCGDSNIAE